MFPTNWEQSWVNSHALGSRSLISLLALNTTQKAGLTKHLNGLLADGDVMRWGNVAAQVVENAVRDVFGNDRFQSHLRGARAVAFGARRATGSLARNRRGYCLAKSCWHSGYLWWWRFRPRTGNPALRSGGSRAAAQAAQEGVIVTLKPMGEARTACLVSGVIAACASSFVTYCSPLAEAVHSGAQSPDRRKGGKGCVVSMSAVALFSSPAPRSR